jgi:ferredoxin, 2Fe-2S
MIKIHYVQPCGAKQVVVAAVGQSVMEVAVANNVPGIDADCGGQCACGTCQVYVDEPWGETLPAARVDEVEMLSFAETTTAQSRLACQIQLDASHDGIVIRLPEAQH